eukprot:GABU01005088.1.p1 GENE.GABU01005088.1~~GABU01005088.1.p1  ORF type:complete len:395 (-),score=109.77 GABU01005088.1:8-1132(-)
MALDLHSPNEYPSNEAEFLLSIKKQERGPEEYSIDISDDQDPRRKHKMYLIVRSLKGEDGKMQRGYSLRTGDTIKLGRIEFNVVELYTPNSHMHNKQSNLKINEETFDIDTQVIPKDTELICRYCLIDQKDNNVDTIDSALVYCCSCAGSAGGVHFACLKNWISNKLVARTNLSTVTYQWKKLECEVCKIALPRKMKFKGKVHELINIERPNSPYIMLERLTATTGQTEPVGSTITVITPNDGEKIKLGRGHQCDLRISDISVSRVHAMLQYEKDRSEFLIVDNESKFGTLILLNKDYKIKNDKAAIQIGRTVFTFILKPAPQDHADADPVYPLAHHQPESPLHPLWSRQLSRRLFSLQESALLLQTYFLIQSP